MKKAAFLAVYLFPILVASGYVLGGVFHLMTPIFIFLAIPVADFLMGRFTTNPEESNYKSLKDAFYFKAVTWAFVPVQLLLVFGGAYASRALSGFEFWAFAIATGLVTGGAGITIAHELGHRSGRWEQFLAKVLLACVNYTHFFIEHNRGHHANVATPDDPATARLGESVYAFLPRTVWGSFHHAWLLENRRFEKAGRSPWNLGNHMIWFSMLPLFIGTLLFLVWGPLAVLFFFVQAAVAVLLLELVNYIEHYGLQRDQREDGRYEKVRPEHSWNASEMVTNSFLFQLQRHSDHHAYPTRRYQTLRHWEQAPQLPTGYAGMILLALCPPLWRRVMDPRVRQATA